MNPTHTEQRRQQIPRRSGCEQNRQQLRQQQNQPNNLNSRLEQRASRPPALVASDSSGLIVLVSSTNEPCGQGAALIRTEFRWRDEYFSGLNKQLDAFSAAASATALKSKAAVASASDDNTMERIRATLQRCDALLGNAAGCAQLVSLIDPSSSPAREKV